MTSKEMMMKGKELRMAAKDLQRKILMKTDPEERKEMARKMQEMFNEAKLLRDKAKNQHWFDTSMEQEFLNAEAEWKE